MKQHEGTWNVIWALYLACLIHNIPTTLKQAEDDVLELGFRRCGLEEK
jgi:hypothetical protein